MLITLVVMSQKIRLEYWGKVSGWLLWQEKQKQKMVSHRHKNTPPPSNIWTLTTPFKAASNKHSTEARKCDVCIFFFYAEQQGWGCSVGTARWLISYHWGHRPRASTCCRLRHSHPPCQLVGQSLSGWLYTWQTQTHTLLQLSVKKDYRYQRVWWGGWVFFYLFFKITNWIWCDWILAALIICVAKTLASRLIAGVKEK